MADVRCKEGVQFQGFTKALCWILLNLCKVQTTSLITVTAGSNGNHLPDSKHYKFMAVDIRCKQYSPTRKAQLVVELKTLLGDNFTVLHEDVGNENEHIHIQLKKGLMTWPVE